MNQAIEETRRTIDMAQALAIPGQLLGSADQYVAGAGTHIHDSNLYASVLGTVSVVGAQSQQQALGPQKRLTRIVALRNDDGTSNNNAKSNNGSGAKATISVSRSGVAEKREVLPEVGNAVLCRVTRITPRHANVAILVVGDTVLEAEWAGMIRVQDVRATEKDRVKIYESFRPGDIVRAQVVSTRLHSQLLGIVMNVLANINGIDLARRSGQLLPLDREQRTRRHHGHKRGGKHYVPC